MVNCGISGFLPSILIERALDLLAVARLFAGAHDLDAAFERFTINPSHRSPPVAPFPRNSSSAAAVLGCWAFDFAGRSGAEQRAPQDYDWLSPTPLTNAVKERRQVVGVHARLARSALRSRSRNKAAVDRTCGNDRPSQPS